MELHSVHASGSAAHDRLAFLDRFARFIPAAFYYKTFMWPRKAWHQLFEPVVREAAGLGAQVILLQELFETPYFCKDHLASHFDLARPIAPQIERGLAIAAHASQISDGSYTRN